MLHLNELTYRLGERLLIDGATVALPTGAHVGLIGRNGAGKTTLFRLICGELSPESGAIGLPRRTRIGRVEQEAPGGAQALIDFVLEADAERQEDDGFEYFQRWLISKGRKVFSAVLDDPDCLTDILAEELGGPLEFEEFAYVAGEVWSEKTEISVDDSASSYPTGGATPQQPSGVEFEDSEEHLAARYPKLWARFGNTPLT